MSNISLEELLLSDIYADQDEMKDKTKRSEKVLYDEEIVFPTMEVCSVLCITRQSLYDKKLSGDYVRRKAYAKATGVGFGDTGITPEGVRKAMTGRSLGRISSAVKINMKGIDVGNDEDWRVQGDVLSELVRERFIDINALDAWMKIAGRKELNASTGRSWNIASTIWRASAVTRENEIFENVFLILNILMKEIGKRIEFNELTMRIEFREL